MDHNEQKQIREYISEHLDFSSTRMTDDEAAFLKNFVNGHHETFRSQEDQPKLDYNPLEAQVRAAREDIERLELHRAELLVMRAWVDSFNLDEETAEIARLRAGLEASAGAFQLLEVDICDLEAQAQLLDSDTPLLELDARLGLRVQRIFTSEHHGIKNRLNAVRTLPGEHTHAKSRLAARPKAIQHVREHLQVAVRERDRLTREIAELSESVDEKERVVERFRGFVSGEVEEKLAEIDGELLLLHDERAQLARRAMDVDRVIEAPLAVLRKYEVEIEEYESAIFKLQAELSQLQGQADEIERIQRDLSRAGAGDQRATLHDECERRFGHRRPGDASREIRRQMGPLRNDVAERQHKIRQTRRHIAKTEQRITDLVTVAARDIDALIIDGNNCCYQDGDFIGLRALIPMTKSLADRFSVTVVFDAAIRKQLRAGDGWFRSALPAATVHVVAPGSKADETILDAANEPTIWVISNDMFSDFGDKAPVQEDRVIRHEILLGRVLVHDLDVNEPLLAV